MLFFALLVPRLHAPQPSPAHSTVMNAVIEIKLELLYIFFHFIYLFLF